MYSIFGYLGPLGVLCCFFREGLFLKWSWTCRGGESKQPPKSGALLSLKEGAGNSRPEPTSRPKSASQNHAMPTALCVEWHSGIAQFLQCQDNLSTIGRWTMTPACVPPQPVKVEIQDHYAGASETTPKLQWQHPRQSPIPEQHRASRTSGIATPVSGPRSL